MKIKIIFATILLFAIIIYGSYTIYIKYNNPEYFICDRQKLPNNDIFLPYKEYNDIYNVQLWVAPSCEDGVYAYTLPYIGKIYKNDTKLGILLIIITILLSYRGILPWITK
jgi:hypothetical protein